MPVNNRKIKKVRSRPVKGKINFAFFAVSGAKLLAGALIIVGLSLVCAFGYSVITQCDYLKAKKVYVSGAAQVSKETILKQAKMKPGVNILAANLRVVQKRLLVHPDIIKAEVGRIFPNILYIHVKEHQPLAIVDFENQYVMNTEGEIYKKCHKHCAGNLPVVTGLAFSDFSQPAERKKNPYTALMQILKWDRDELRRIMNGPIKRIHVDGQMGISIIPHPPGTVLKLGYGHYEKKIQTLKKVLNHMNNNHHLNAFRVIDMMKTDRVILSPVLLKESDLNSKEV